jgi:hypothetical protein
VSASGLPLDHAAIPTSGGNPATRFDFLASGALIALTFAIPYLPFTATFGFVPLPGGLIAAIATIAALYVIATELRKKWFYRHGFGGEPRPAAVSAPAV